MSKSRGSAYGLRIPALDIRPGDRLMLMGPSGSGKSTSLDLLALVLKPDDSAEFNWRPEGGPAFDLAEAWRRRRSGALSALRLKNLGYVLQTGGLLPFLTVGDNILLPAEMSGLGRPDMRRRLEELSQELGISHLLDKYPAQVSVGERQRCAIARAVIHRPALILADEPTASLDPPTADRVFELLLRLSRQSALVVATHDLSRAARHDFQSFQIVCAPSEDGGTEIEARLVPAKANSAV